MTQFMRMQNPDFKILIGYYFDATGTAIHGTVKSETFQNPQWILF